MTPPPQDPLDFALALMRDPSKPDSLRAAMAKAALPYLYKRGEERAKGDARPEPEPKREPMSDLELARRIAHILTRGKAQQEREAAEKTAVRNGGGREAGGALPPPERGRVGVGVRLRHDRPPPGSHSASKTRVNALDALADLPLSGGGEAAAPGAREDERAPAIDPFDPHPGYRWI